MRKTIFKSIVFLLPVLIFFGSFSNISDKQTLLLKDNSFERIASQEKASVNGTVSPYTEKNCTTVKHSDGKHMKFCIADFKGTTDGFYDPDNEVMMVSSFDQYSLIHEIFHATSMHYLNQGYVDMKSKDTQEKMAYNAENLLMQINAFKEDMQLQEALKKQSQKVSVNKVSKAKKEIALK